MAFAVSCTHSLIKKVFLSKWVLLPLHGFFVVCRIILCRERHSS
jgi:hypothetical protein